MRRRSIVLFDCPVQFIYIPKSNPSEWLPEDPFKMRSHGYTFQVTFSVRKLRFSEGYSPARNIRFERVPYDPIVY
jgi:hypothetical protein